MHAHTDLTEQQIICSQPIKTGQCREADESKYQEYHRGEVCHKGVARTRRDRHANRGEGRTDQDQSNVASLQCTCIKIPCGLPQPPDDGNEQQRGQQGKNKDGKGTGEFGDDNAQWRNGLGGQQFHGSGSVLLRKAAHRDGGHHDHEHPRCEDEK